MNQSQDENLLGTENQRHERMTYAPWHMCCLKLISLLAIIAIAVFGITVAVAVKQQNSSKPRGILETQITLVSTITSKADSSASTGNDLDALLGHVETIEAPTGLGTAASLHATVDCIFVRWLKFKGETVDVKDPLLLVLVEGSKVEILASSSGAIKEMGEFEAGDVVKKGKFLFTIGHPGPQPLAAAFAVLLFIVALSAILRLQGNCDEANYFLPAILTTNSYSHMAAEEMPPVDAPTAPVKQKTARAERPGLPHISRAATAAASSALVP